MSAKQVSTFEDIVGRLSGFLDVHPDTIASDLLNLILRHGATKRFVTEYQNWSAK